jgi:hypothetical protein
VVIDNLDIIGVIALPYKADAPLLVNPDAMLTLSIKMQRLQIIGRWNSQGFKKTHGIQHFELDCCRSLNRLWQFCRKLSIKQFFGLFAFECPDHATYYPEEILTSRDIINQQKQSPDSKSQRHSGAAWLVILFLKFWRTKLPCL